MQPDHWNCQVARLGLVAPAEFTFTSVGIMILLMADLVRRYKQRVMKIEATAFLLSTMVCTMGLLMLRRFEPVPRSHRSWRNPLVMQMLCILALHGAWLLADGLVMWTNGDMARTQHHLAGPWLYSGLIQQPGSLCLPMMAPMALYGAFEMTGRHLPEDPIRLKMLTGYNALMYGLAWFFLRQQFRLGRQTLPNRLWMGCHVLVAINMVTWCGEVGWYCPSGKSRTLFAQTQIWAAIVGPSLCVWLFGNAWRQLRTKKMPKPKYKLQSICHGQLSV